MLVQGLDTNFVVLTDERADKHGMTYNPDILIKPISVALKSCQTANSKTQCIRISTVTAITRPICSSSLFSTRKNR